MARLVGVIDLKNQQAVHAVAGKRDLYRPVSFCGGDPHALARHYLNLGVSALYIADLDAIAGHNIQFDTINQIGADFGPRPVLLDTGWTGDEQPQVEEQIRQIANSHSHCKWVAATESMRSRDSLKRFARLVGPEQLLLGIDFVDNQPMGLFHPGDWIETALAIGVRGAVILDLISVGGSSGPTTHELCKLTKRCAPSWTLYSGGGVRTADDVNSLVAAGCDWCLVATALHGILSR